MSVNVALTLQKRDWAVSVFLIRFRYVRYPASLLAELTILKNKFDEERLKLIKKKKMWPYLKTSQAHTYSKPPMHT